MLALEARLTAYYDQEAESRERRPLDPRRSERLFDFAQLLHAERRRTVLEIGTGPGRDATLLQAQGCLITGVDLSPEHVKRCRARGIPAKQASVHSLPYGNDTFEAGWTMSTLLHVPNDQFRSAMDEIRRVLIPGAPIAIGLWGGRDNEALNEFDSFEPKRFFSSRTNETLLELLEPHGAIERFDTWPHETITDLLYQWCILRVED